MEAREITLQELNSANPAEYILVDVRDAMSFSYGHLPDAVNVPMEQLSDWEPQDSERLVVVYCKKGQVSMEAAEQLCDRGIEAVSLQGGYMEWLMTCALAPKKNEKTAADIEESLRKKFRKTIWCRFTRAVREYELVQEGDKIAVCISGGKDSMLMAKLFQELKRQ